MRRRPVPLIVPTSAVIAGSYVLALLFFSLAVGASSNHPWFAGTYYGCVAASAALSVLSVALGQAWVSGFIACLRCYLIIVLGYGVSAYLSVKLTLGAGLMVEVCALVPYPANLALCAALGSAIVLAQVFPGFMGASQLVEATARARPDEVLALAALLAMAAGAAAMIGRLVSVNDSLGRALRMQERSVDTLAELNKNLQGYARTADEDSAERERARISREIHDISGYIFTNLIALMDAAGSLPPDDRETLLDLVGTARKQAQEGLQETRAALRKLRDEKPRMADNARAMHKIVSIFRTVAGIDVDLELGNLPRLLPTELNLTLYRAIQEGLTNAVRHGKATAVRIRFWVDDDLVRLSIADNGRGADELTKGIGLSGMEERVGSLGGSVRTGRSPEGGFLLSVDVPLGTGPASTPARKAEATA